MSKKIKSNIVYNAVETEKENIPTSAEGQDSLLRKG